MGDAVEVSRRLGGPLFALGGAFMVGPEMKAEAAAVGTRRGSLYFRGRVGVLGELTAETSTGLLAIFPEWLVRATWTDTAELPTATAVARYRAANAAWGRTNLADLPGLTGTAERMLAVVDADWTGTLPLVEAWRRVPRPTDPAELAAHAATLLRELRGALHFAALAVHAVPVPMAVLADPSGGVPRLLRTGWPQDQVDELAARFRPEYADGWLAAQEDTDRAFAARLTGALGPDGAATLADEADTWYSTLTQPKPA
jgi:hypothetical protein